MYAQKNRNLDGTSKIRITEFRVVVNGKNFVFENASPYVEKFNRVLEKLLEAGLINYWNRYDVLKKRDDFPMSDNNFLKMQMVAIFVFGFIASTLIFFAELVWYYCK